jgi:hypothetical protein
MMAMLCEMNPQERQNLLLYMAQNGVGIEASQHCLQPSSTATKNTNVIEFSCTNRPTYFSRGQTKENHAIS